MLKKEREEVFQRTSKILFDHLILRSVFFCFLFFLLYWLWANLSA